MSSLATVNARGTLAARPAAAAANEGYIYSASDAGLYRSNGSSWDTIGGSGIADQGTFTFLDGTVAAAPATPAAGKLRLYAKTGKVLAVKDDAGVETVLGAGGGGGGAGQNVITNGRFRTNQRGYASGGALASGDYCFDRWKATTASTSLAFAAAAQGQAVTISSGGSVAQIVEQPEVPAGDYVLSWEGTATGRVYNEGGSAPSYAASPVLVTLDGTANVRVEFQASGGTKTLDKVKLEAGSIATAYVQPNVANEMIACQRFFQYVASFVGIGDGSSSVFGISHQFPVPMRAAPTIAKWPNAVLVYRDISATPDHTIAFATWGIANVSGSVYGFWLQITGSTSVTDSRPYNARFGGGGTTGPILSCSADL